MRAVYMGTPAFAVPSLRGLAAVHDVALVVTRADRRSGRSGALRPPAVKIAAEELGIPVLQPASLRGDTVRAIADARPDVICVAAFGMLLPAEVLAIPRNGCLNVHASLLPRYRGAAPIQRAILDGADVTGVSIMRMEEGLDTGPFMLQRVVSVDELYANELEQALATLGAAALVEALALLESDSGHWTTQVESLATYASKISKDDVALAPQLSSCEAFARVRASTRSAAARACVDGRDLTVVRAREVPAAGPPGSVRNADGALILGLSGGGLALDVVRPAGKGDMLAEEWARGARLSGGAEWRATR